MTATNGKAPSDRAADQLNAQLRNIGMHAMLSVPYGLATLDDMVLSKSLRDRLTRIVREQSKSAELTARGLRPARKLLFSGLPGTGKTMAAGALSRAIGMPMFRVETHGVFSSLFAESAQRLARVFDFVGRVRAVYLFDEFDALGADREQVGSKADGGEARRVTNALLQFIEGDQSESIIVAASNHAQMLDSAIFRRFDEMVVFEALTKEEIVELVRRKLDGYEVDVDTLDWNAICDVNGDLGHADLCAAIDRVCKDYIVEGVPITTEAIDEGITNRMRMRITVCD